jgi:hypothetical protein
MDYAPTFALFMAVVVMVAAFINWAIATVQKDKDGQP